MTKFACASLLLAAVVTVDGFRFHSLARAPLRRNMVVKASVAGDDIVPATIVGANGRIGALLSSLGSGNDVLVDRGEPIPADGSGPILLCTRNDVLEDIIDNCPESRREDLVFMQNGYLDELLKRKGLAKNTQALIYFAVAKKGEPPIDGQTDTNPEGLTQVTGKWAGALASRVRKAGLSCFVVDADTYRKAMFEKLIWISAFMLVGAVSGGVKVGEVESKYKEDVSSLILEMCKVITEQHGVEFDGQQTVDRLCAYARSVGHFPTAIKEFDWRNGFFWKLSEEAEDMGLPEPTPIHTQLCNAGFCDGFFDF